MLVEGTVAAPLLWAGVPPVLVHNLLLLGAIVASAAGVFVLVRTLTGSAAGGIVAGTVFAFVPYRFDHFMHMELQWTMWMPWTFWAVHRAIESARVRDGLLAGVFFSLQMLSSIYYGMFLAISLLVGGAVLLLRRLPAARRSLRVIAPGVVLALVVCGMYSQPYIETSRSVGPRDVLEIRSYSARHESYLVSMPNSPMWGWVLPDENRAERRLFPGALATALAAAALIAGRSLALPYLAVGVVMFDLSLGFSGLTFPLLYDNVPIFHGLRAISRAGIFVLFAIATLAGLGFSAVAVRASAPIRTALTAAVCAAMLLEYRVTALPLRSYDNDPSAVESWLRGQPPGVVVHLPMGELESLPGPEAHYAYLSTFHWKPIVNGYSGYFPESFLDRVRAMRSFPDDVAMAQLRRDGVRYVVVHMEDYSDQEQAHIRAVMTRYGMPVLARFAAGATETTVWGLQ
jgi:hypothetical protein